MQVDKQATKVARARHQRGVDRLRALLGVMVELDDDGRVKPPPSRVWDVLNRAANFGEPTGRGTPVRMHPNTPTVRDAEHRAKHVKRKAQRAARRRNRSCR